MGRIYTPKYRVEYRDQAGWHSQAWKGTANSDSLEKWRVAMNKSFQTGGNNYLVSEMIGYEPHINRAMIVRQSNSQVVADVKMPMFEVT